MNNAQLPEQQDVYPKPCRFCASTRLEIHHQPNTSNYRIVCHGCQCIGPLGDSPKDCTSLWNGDKLNVGTPHIAAIPPGLSVGAGLCGEELRNESERVFGNQYGAIEGFALVYFGLDAGRPRSHIKLHRVSKNHFEEFCRAVIDQKRVFSLHQRNPKQVTRIKRGKRR